jgi:hypothetical protein
MKPATKRVESAIRKSPGITTSELIEKIKVTTAAVHSSVYAMKKKGINLISTPLGNRICGYSIQDNSGKTNGSKIREPVSESIVKIDPDKMIISDLSDSDRNQYFSFLEKAFFYTESAKLIISARKERISKERTASVNG